MLKMRFIIPLVVLILGSMVAVMMDGTGGDGDSIMHYLYARYAFDHPKLFFDHWAKPLFVLLSAPLAQAGIVGMKFFNLIAGTVAVYLTMKSAEKTKAPNPYAAGIILVAISGFSPMLFSGFTELLFAVGLISSIWLAQSGRWKWALIIVSFLPFVRSEGLLIILIFGSLLMLRGKWKLIPILALAHVLYTIVGWPFTGDVLWTITSNPYADQVGYGSGGPFDFINKFYYTVGIPVVVLFSIGLIRQILRVIEVKRTILKDDYFILVYGSFFIYFIAHSIFWWQGLFHSMGLQRVLLGVSPMIALISLQGFNVLLEAISANRLRTGLKMVLLVLVIVFPFTSNPASPKLKDFQLTEKQQAAIEESEQLKDIFRNGSVYYDAPFLSMVTESDFFDSAIHPRNKAALFENGESGSYYVWDNWFSVVEAGITLDYIAKHDHLVEIDRFGGSTDEPMYVIFRSR